MHMCINRFMFFFLYLLRETLPHFFFFHLFFFSLSSPIWSVCPTAAAHCCDAIMSPQTKLPRSQLPITYLGDNWKIHCDLLRKYCENDFFFFFFLKHRFYFHYWAMGLGPKHFRSLVAGPKQGSRPPPAASPKYPRFFIFLRKCSFSCHAAAASQCRCQVSVLPSNKPNDSDGHIYNRGMGVWGGMRGEQHQGGLSLQMVPFLPA